MNNLLLIFTFLLCLTQPVSALADEGDYFRIVAAKDYVFTVSDVSRTQFQEFYKDNCTDTIVISRQECESLCSLLAQLKLVKELPVCSDQVLMKSIERKGKLYWIESCTLDNRVMLVLYLNNKKKIIWMDGNYVDQNDGRYDMSEDLKSFLSKYIPWLHK